MSFLACSKANDQTLGPGIRGCRDDFDFTVQFEQLFFSLAPSAVFIFLSVWRSIALALRPAAVEAPRLWLGKLVCTALSSHRFSCAEAHFQSRHRGP